MVNGTASIANEVLGNGDALRIAAPGDVIINAVARAEVLIFELADVQLGQSWKETS